MPRFWKNQLANFWFQVVLSQSVSVITGQIVVQHTFGFVLVDVRLSVAIAIVAISIAMFAPSVRNDSVATLDVSKDVTSRTQQELHTAALIIMHAWSGLFCLVVGICLVMS